MHDLLLLALSPPDVSTRLVVWTTTRLGLDYVDDLHPVVVDAGVVVVFYYDYHSMMMKVL